MILEKPIVSTVLFENNLRVQDNLALRESLKTADKVIGIYCFDDDLLTRDSRGLNRIGFFRLKFLLESLNNLKQNLTSIGIPLLFFRGEYTAALSEISKGFSINSVHTQNEWTLYENRKWDSVRKVFPDLKIYTYDTQFLIEREISGMDIPQLPLSFTSFRNKIEKRLHFINQPIKINHKAQPFEIQELESFTNLPNFESFDIETLDQALQTAFPFKGGEDEAIHRLKDYFFNKKLLSKYKETRNGLLGTDYSSKFSPWLANGSISARQIYNYVKQYEDEIEKNDSTYWLVFELLWRDFFKYTSLKYRNKIFALNGFNQQNRGINAASKKAFELWRNGKTGVPFVDANMIELRATGFMSNRGRQNVASYWCHDLKQDWRIGAAYFESQLIDYDVHSNWLNWAYIAGVGNDPRPDRYFNIARQTEMYDPQRKFINTWLG